MCVESCIYFPEYEPVPALRQPDFSYFIFFGTCPCFVVAITLLLLGLFYGSQYNVSLLYVAALASLLVLIDVVIVWCVYRYKKRKFHKMSPASAFDAL